MLHLAEWAHKKEVEQDGALARLQGSLIEDSPLPPPSNSSSSSSSNDSGEGVIAPEGEPLNSFWRRYNQSLLGKVAFQERRDALLKENRMLQVRQRKGRGERETCPACVSVNAPHFSISNYKLKFALFAPLQSYSLPFCSTWTG